MHSEFFSEQSVQHLYDEVLMRCIVQFRQAINMLERSDLTYQNMYLQEMQEGLSNMEAELSRRQRSLNSCSDDPVPPFVQHVILHFPFNSPSAESHHPA